MRLTLGAIARGRGRCTFLLWAPCAERVDLTFLYPRGRRTRMSRLGGGYHHARLDGVAPGTLYTYHLDGLVERPDPASRFQPHGPRGPSCVTPSRFDWQDRGWSGQPLGEYILLEGSNPQTPFEDLIAALPKVRSLGATALSVRFGVPPERLSGYPFAVPPERGGPRGLKRLVNACHRLGLAVMLTVPLFELGHEGDPFVAFGPYVEGRTRRIRLDGPGSDDVRRYFVEAVLHWFREFHADALDIGNIDRLADPSPKPLLEELALVTREEGRRTGRPLSLIVQSGRNDPRLIRRQNDGGMGLGALWNPDFGLALQGVLARGKRPPPPDFGKLEHLKKAFLEGFVHSGAFSASRQQRHGRPSRNLPGDCFLVRCPAPPGPSRRDDVTREEKKAVMAALLLSPYVPLVPFGGAADTSSGGVPDAYFGELARLRKELHAAGLLDKQCMGVLGYGREKLLLIRHWMEDSDLIILFHFGRNAASVPIPVPSGSWALRFDSADSRWSGPGSAMPDRLQGDGGDMSLSFAPLSCAVYLRQHGE